MPRLLPVLEYPPMSPDLEEPAVVPDSQESKVAWDSQESPMSPDPDPDFSDSYSPSEWVFEVSPFYDYLYDVAITGKSSMPWEEVQPAFIEYFERCFRHFSHEACDISEGSEIMRIHRFVCQKIEGFNDFPFTFRRLCELLVDPTRCYNKLPKFMRALERVVNVVSTSPLYPQRKPPPKPEQEEPKLESLFFRNPTDEFDQLHVSDYGPEENEESADSCKSMWDSDESPMCCTDSTCSTCDSRSTCDDSDAIPRTREPQDDTGGGGDGETRIKRQKAGADVAIPVLEDDDSGPEYDADTDEKAEEQVSQRAQKRVKRRRNKNCRKRRRNDEAFMK
ncbi:PPP4R2 protein, partial [Ancylostoma duodenale]